MAAQKKSELRAASIGYEFRDSRVRDMSFRSGQTLLGHDVVLLSIDGLQHVYGRYTSDWYMGRLSLDDSASVQISDDIARRRRELKTLLEVGGTIVLFAPAPD